MSVYRASSETQGQIVGARESLNGLRAIFSRPFRLSLAPCTICPWVSEDVYYRRQTEYYF